MSGMSGLPRWRLDQLFPSLDSAEYRKAVEEARAGIAALCRTSDELGIDRPQPGAPPAAPGDVDRLIAEYNRLHVALEPLQAYPNLLVAADAADEAAQAAAYEMRTLLLPLHQLAPRVAAWIGGQDLARLCMASPLVAEHRYPLELMQEASRRQMSPREEDLQAELDAAGLWTFAALHSDVTSLLTVSLRRNGRDEEIPMAEVRNLAHDPDRGLRRRAYQAELAAWKRVEVPLAAALNGVKGFQSIRNRRRGYGTDVEASFLDNHITPRTLAAMQEACVGAFPDLRRYLRLKAGCLGLERASFYDIGAPLGEPGPRVEWPAAEDFTCEQFGKYSAELRDFARESFENGWIDAEPRPGKEGGAFCAGVGGGNSRILMNYGGTSNALSTLAHELGHAYHNRRLAGRTPLQHETPSTLAETASIFCETLVFEACLETARGAERLALLDTQLQRDLMVVVDIHSRYLFETRVLTQRAARQLTPSEFCSLMLDAQRETYGDGLNPEELHAYMWAVKGHYYGPLFYNYPYTFGLLFGLGLYSRYRDDPSGFRASYDDLLSRTGMHSAAELARRFNFDLESPEFWNVGLDYIRRSIRAFAGECGGVDA